MKRAKLIAGIVKEFTSLPTNYFIGSTRINLEKATNVIKRAEGFYQVEEAVLGVNEERLPLIESDLDTNQTPYKWIERKQTIPQSKVDDAKLSKIAQVKSELIQQAKDVYWDLDNTKTKEQIITIAKNQFQIKKDEINALNTLEEVNNYNIN